MVNSPETPASKSSRFALVVDDHEDAAKAMELMLQSLGWSTQIAGDGIEALRFANAEKPDLVLLDISMPKLDGFDACGVIRAQPWAQNVRVIAVTGLQEDEVRERSQTAGFDGYLLKPVDFERLKKVTQSI